MRKSIILSVILSLAAPLMASTNLDQQMSLQDKQQTGVVNLTLKQRQALASWIDKHYTPIGQSPLPQQPQAPQQPPSQMMQQPSMQQNTPNQSLSLTINLNNGAELILSDATRWQIHPQDVVISSVWIAPSALSVAAGTDPSYPFVITNLSSKQSVRAKQVVPASPMTPSQAPSPSLSK